MKTIWKMIALSVVFTMIAAACAPAPAPAPVQVEVTRVVKETEIVKEVVKEVVKETVVVKETAVPVVPAQAEPAESSLFLTAVKVDTLPTIDGDGSDEQWKSAPKAQIGGTVWKAIYTDSDLALLIKWPDRTLTMHSTGDYRWDPATNSWSQVYTGEHTDTFNIAWSTNTKLAEENCNAFCHEDPPGSGYFHHQTTTADETVDSWMILGKHGWGYWRVKGLAGVQSQEEFGHKEGDEDQAWTFGSVLAKQNGPLTCVVTDPEKPCQILAGDVTFIDYSEDTIIVGPNSQINVDRDRPRDKYCQDCHNQIKLPYDPLEFNLTMPDVGEINHIGNWEVPYTTPAYMEISPTDYVDAQVLTQDEIDNGEAVMVADLTPQQISQYWDKYAEVNGVVPNLVLKVPTESMADVLTGANWKNGVWTLEITRKLVTPWGEDDVQFDDLTKDYPFTTVMYNGFDLLMGAPASTAGKYLRFQP